MKILFIHPYHIDYPGGAERWIVEIVKKLRNKGYEFGVLYVNYGSCKEHVHNSRELEEYDTELYVCNHIKLPRGFPIINPRCVLSHIRSYDVAYVMAYPPNELLLRALKKYMDVPLIAGFHSSLEPWRLFLHKLYIPLYMSAYRSFNALHVLNRSFYSILTEHYGVDRSKVYLIPNGIDTSKYSIRYNNEKFCILWTGRLYPEKGADILCKIIIEFNRKYPYLRNEVRFIITGMGSYEKYVRSLAKLFNNVKYLGYVDDNTLKKLYASSHLYLVTSRSEGMPLRVLEAMASGLPIVGSDIPGICDLVLNQHIGELVRVDDIYGFCKAIERYYNLWRDNSEKYYTVRETIREYTIANYDWNIIINRIENMFRQVLLDRKRKF
ncbi:MAG: hypothetical protein DRZ82_09810 [Thermoprotei archaeon]|nr:MAG: hypothetical protein DRZ82_09810 [Thermoprotei archaeon]